MVEAQEYASLDDPCIDARIHPSLIVDLRHPAEDDDDGVLEPHDILHNAAEAALFLILKGHVRSVKS